MSDTEIRMMRYTIEELSEQIRLTKQELDRTRKALGIAVDALKDIRCIYTGDQTTKPSTMFGRAAGALNKITATLENKNE